MSGTRIGRPFTLSRRTMDRLEALGWKDESESANLFVLVKRNLTVVPSPVHAQITYDAFANSWSVRGPLDELLPAIATLGITPGGYRVVTECGGIPR